MKLLMIDNYDSFTYNIVQYLGELGAEVEVVRNDEITIAQIGERIAAGTTRLVISPGPCSPAEAGVSVDAIREFAGRLQCLGADHDVRHVVRRGGVRRSRVGQTVGPHIG